MCLLCSNIFSYFFAYIYVYILYKQQRIWTQRVWMIIIIYKIFPSFTYPRFSLHTCEKDNKVQYTRHIGRPSSPHGMLNSKAFLHILKTQLSHMWYTHTHSDVRSNDDEAHLNGMRKFFIPLFLLSFSFFAYILFIF